MPKRTAFLSENEVTPSGEQRRHLRIVISDADTHNQHIVVSVTSLRFDGQDKSCIIYPHEHEFIRHISIVDFKRTKIMHSADILNGILKGLLIKKEDISEQLLARIQNALKQSKYISQQVKSLFPYL